jgi:hypothetical protein
MNPIYTNRFKQNNIKKLTDLTYACYIRKLFTKSEIIKDDRSVINRCPNTRNKHSKKPSVKLKIIYLVL